MWWTLIKANPLTTLLLVVVAGLSATVWFQSEDIKHWQGKYDRERASLIAEQAKYTQLLASVTVQNAQVDAWKKEAAARAEAEEAAMVVARSAQAQADTLSRRLNAVKPTGDECHDLQALVDEFVAAGRVRN